MKAKRKMVVIATAVIAVSGGIIGSSKAFAQGSEVFDDPMSSLVTRISERFSLDKDEVKQVFDAELEEQHRKMLEKSSQDLTELVKDGKITEAQKQLIIDKRSELHSSHMSKMMNLQGSTREEIRAAMEKEKSELEQWAKDNGIDVSYVFGGMRKMGFGGGMRGSHFFGK